MRVITYEDTLNLIGQMKSEIDFQSLSTESALYVFNMVWRRYIRAEDINFGRIKEMIEIALTFDEFLQLECIKTLFCAWAVEEIASNDSGEYDD